MEKKIFLLEYIDYDHYDEIDQENVEERYIIGYFSSEYYLNVAKKHCQEKGIKKDLLVVTDYYVNLRSNQKNIFLLNYEYSILRNNEYEDYYYYFEPCGTMRECMVLKERLLEESKYQADRNKIYNDSIDGFFIKKIKINFLSHISYCDINEII